MGIKECKCFLLKYKDNFPICGYCAKTFLEDGNVVTGFGENKELAIKDLLNKINQYYDLFETIEVINLKI